MLPLHYRYTADRSTIEATYDQKFNARMAGLEPATNRLLAPPEFESGLTSSKEAVLTSYTTGLQNNHLLSIFCQ